MSDYLEDLGRQLDAAAARRVAGRRRLPRPAPVAVAGVAALAVGVIVLTSGGQTPERPAPGTERPASVVRIGVPFDKVSPPPPGLADVPVTVANGTLTPGLGATFADQLENAGWTIKEIVNASQTDLAMSTVVGEGADAVGEALGLPVGGRFDFGGVNPRLAIVLGADAAPSAHVIRARPGETPGGACLELRLPDDVPLTSCGTAPTDSEPLGLVTVATLPSGRWLVYGYATEGTEAVAIGRELTVQTRVKAGVPGRYFLAETDPMPAVFVGALGADLAPLGSVGSLEPSDEKLTSKDQARAAGDLAGFAPSMSTRDQTFVFEGAEIAPAEARRRGLSCAVDDSPVVRCTDPPPAG